MRLTALGAAGLLAASLLYVTPAQAADPLDWFNKGVQFDVAGDADQAFAAYLKAAELGFPDAEFNVAAMLDSGRGTPSNIDVAAVWYARAAAHGHRRAAYNLGQLYEAGLGVSKNLELAHAWFKASNLAAARNRGSATGPPDVPSSLFLPPKPVFPQSGATVDGALKGVELVWTTGEQPEPVRYFVEIRALTGDHSNEVFSSYVSTSSVFATIPYSAPTYAWRVVTVAGGSGRYAPSAWRLFTIVRDNALTSEVK